MTDCYVGFKTCGCAAAAAVIAAEHAGDNARFVRDCRRRGLSVEIRPVEWVRGNLRRCEHEKTGKRARRFSESNQIEIDSDRP